MVGLFQGICNVYNPQYELGFSKSKSGKYPKMVTSLRKIMINCGISGYLYHVLKESFSRGSHYIFAIDSSSEALLGGWKDAPFQICHKLRYFEAAPVSAHWDSSPDFQSDPNCGLTLWDTTRLLWNAFFFLANSSRTFRWFSSLMASWFLGTSLSYGTCTSNELYIRDNYWYSSPPKL